jgi:transmembrane sensor
MKTDRDMRPYAEKLAKYLGGEMSEAESQAFKAEIPVSGENMTGIEKLKKLWSAMNGYKADKNPDTRKAWDKLHGRLREEQLIPAPRVAVKNRFMPPILKIAAVLVILLGIGAVIYLNMSHTPAADLVHVSTGNEANTLIKTLADGSVIYIAQNSLFSFPEEFKSGSRNVELKGEAFFDVASNPGRPFIIETDEVLIQVLGTAFNVKTQNGNGFELIVERGKVKVTLKTDPSGSETVVAGEKISSLHNSLVKSKHVADEAGSWYKKRMHFKDETLLNIIHVLNRNFNTTFVLADEKTGEHKLTVTFDNETAETMTELICVTLNLKSQIINGAVVFSENREGERQH